MTNEFARGFVEATRCVTMECEELLRKAKSAQGAEFDLATARLEAVTVLAERLAHACSVAAEEALK